jgi:hypothetical protein
MPFTDRHVRVVVEQIAKRMADRGRLDQVGRHLVQQRLEGVVVVLVDKHDLRVRVLQLLRRPDAPEPAPQDHDLRTIRHRTSPVSTEAFTI